MFIIRQALNYRLLHAPPYAPRTVQCCEEFIIAKWDARSVAVFRPHTKSPTAAWLAPGGTEPRFHWWARKKKSSCIYRSLLLIPTTKLNAYSPPPPPPVGHGSHDTFSLAFEWLCQLQSPHLAIGKTHHQQLSQLLCPLSKEEWTCSANMPSPGFQSNNW